MIRRLFTVVWQLPLALSTLCVLFTSNAQAQSTGWRVTESKVVGSKVYLDLDLRLLEDQLEILHNGLTSAASATWGDVLSNGGNPGMDVNFSGYDANGIADVTATGTITADSLVLNKDADITGRLNVTNVVTLSDSLKVSGFVEFGDSLEVVKAVAIGETLFVTGVTSLGDSLHVVGNVDFDALFNVDGAATFGSTLTVTGEATLNDSLHVNSGANITGTLYADSISVTDVINGQVSSLANHDTDDLSEGSNNLYFTDARARAAISEGTGVTITNGQIAIGQAVATTSDVTFDELYADSLQASGSLTVTGVTTLNDSLHVGRNLDVTGTLDISGITTLNDSLHVNSSADIQDNLNVDGTVSTGSGSATGSRSMARGFNAVASGAHALALDSLSTAAGMSSKAIGRESSANASDAIALGFNSTAADPLSWTTYGMGWHAVAIGADSESAGTHSYTLGALSTVDSSATNAYALGYSSKVGTNSQFGIAMGPYSELGSNYSTGGIALGYASKVGVTGYAPFAMAFGFESKAENVNAMAFGYQSEANTWHAMAFGELSIASGPHSMAFGQSSTASGDQAMTFGRNAAASGPHAIAFGESSQANGYASRAFGYEANASGSSAFALGYQSTASGYNAFGFGNQSKATGSNAMAMGDNSEANAWNSLALGYKAKTTGSQSFVHAAESEATSLHQVILGSYADATPFSSADAENWVETDPLVVIGNGSGTSDRTNAFVMRKDGAAMFSDSLHVGRNLDVTGTLDISGQTTLNDSLHVNSGANISATLYADSISVTDVINGQVSSLANHDTDDLTEGSSNLYFTEARARAAISEGTGVTITAGQIAIGQAVSITSDVTFDELYADSLQASGTLNVTGITTLNDSLHVNSGADINATLYADSISTPGLNVTENFTYTDGTQGAGKLLTSDANGNATWSEAPLGFNHYEAWIDHASIIAGVTASTTSAHMFVDSTSTQSYDPNNFFGLSAGQITVSTPGYYEIEGYVFGSRSTTSFGFVTASVQVGTATLPQCTATEQWTSGVESSVRTNCRVLVSPGQPIQLNIVEQSSGTSNITDAGIVIRKVGNASIN